MKRERIKSQKNLHKPNNNSNFVGEIQNTKKIYTIMRQGRVNVDICYTKNIQQ